MKLLKTLAAFALLFNATQPRAQEFLKAKGQQIVNASRENVLLRGIGLGGWMLQEGYMLGLKDSGQQHVIRQRLERILSKQQVEEFYNTWLDNHTTKADIDSLKAWGFNSVRLPMHYALYTLPSDQVPVTGSNTWLEKGFALTDSLLSWCRSNEIYLILDMHAAPGGQGNDVNISDRDPSKPALWESEDNRQKLIALWKQLATRYANEPWVGAYDIINEPNWGFTDPAKDKNGTNEKENKPLKQLMVDITKAIREVDKNHLVIIEGNGWGNNYNGILAGGLWDENMALSFHKYWNYNNDTAIKHIIENREKYNVPVWLGETGENSNVWYTQAIGLLEKHNIGWAWWPLKKLGANNPLQVPSNHNYDKLVAYLNGTDSRPPGESDAYSGLLEMATYTNAKSNLVHYDVIDAMMRQPHDPTAKPFKTNKVSNGTVINAADYDLGINGVAYFDRDTADYWVAGKPGAGNKGKVYRNDGVDIYKDSSDYNSNYVGSIEDGEWLQYTINATTAGSYQVHFLVAAANAGGAIRLMANNKSTGTITLSAYQTWSQVVIKNVPLKSGLNTIRLYFDNGGFWLKKFSFQN